MDNIGSRRCLEKAGYRQYGVARRHIFRAGKWHDMWLADVLRDEWLAPPKRLTNLLMRADAMEFSVHLVVRQRQQNRATMRAGERVLHLREIREQTRHLVHRQRVALFDALLHDAMIIADSCGTRSRAIPSRRLTLPR